MALAALIAEDEDALICDLCETYGIVDYTRYTLDFIATLALGLPDTSRIKTKLAGLPVDTRTLMTAAILDNVRTLIWMQSKDGAANRHRPDSLVARLYAANRPKPCVSFRSGADFEAARQSILDRLT